MDSKKTLTIGYAGTLNGYDPNVQSNGFIQALKNWFWTYKVQNLDPSTRSGYFLFKGIAYLKAQYPELGTQLQLHFWGNILPIHHQQAKEMGLEENLKIEGYKTKGETVALLKACDVLFLPLESEKDGQKPLFIPGKLYEYLKIGNPVLALARSSDCVDILKQSGLGIICDPKDPKQIGETLANIIRQKDQLKNVYTPDTDYIEDNFSFEEKTRELSLIFDALLN